METLVQAISGFLVFVGGLLARLGLFLAIPVALALLVGLGLLVARSVRKARARALGLTRVGGLAYRAGLAYAPGHTWVQRRRGALRVGLDDLARKILPNATVAALPAPGTKLEAGQPAMVIASEGRHVAIAMPVGGTIVEVNQAVRANPSLLRTDPYARGWLLAVETEEPVSPLLLTGERARDWFQQESVRLTRFLEKELEVAAADGGEFLLPAPSMLREDQWAALTRSFLKAA